MEQTSQATCSWMCLFFRYPVVLGAPRICSEAELWQWLDRAVLRSRNSAHICRQSGDGCFVEREMFRNSCCWQSLLRICHDVSIWLMIGSGALGTKEIEMYNWTSTLWQLASDFYQTGMIDYREPLQHWNCLSVMLAHAMPPNGSKCHSSQRKRPRHMHLDARSRPLIRSTHWMPMATKSGQEQ